MAATYFLNFIGAFAMSKWFYDLIYIILFYNIDCIIIVVVCTKLDNGTTFGISILVLLAGPPIGNFKFNLNNSKWL